MNSRSSSESRRLQLERLFKEYRNQRFPWSMGFKEIDMLHTLFIQYDVDVRGDIAKLLDAPKPLKIFFSYLVFRKMRKFSLKSTDWVLGILPIPKSVELPEGIQTTMIS